MKSHSEYMAACRYHGLHQTSIFLQSWSISLLFFFLSGFYAIKSGSLVDLLAAGCSATQANTMARMQECTGNDIGDTSASVEDTENALRDSGMVVVLAWSGSRETVLWQHLLAGALRSWSE